MRPKLLVQLFAVLISFSAFNTESSAETKGDISTSISPLAEKSESQNLDMSPIRIDAAQNYLNTLKKQLGELSNASAFSILDTSDAASLSKFLAKHFARIDSLLKQIAAESKSTSTLDANDSYGLRKYISSTNSEIASLRKQLSGLNSLIEAPDSTKLQNENSAMKSEINSLKKMVTESAAASPMQPVQIDVKKILPVEVRREDWVVEPNSSLRKTLERFASRAGWDVIFCLKNQQTLENQDYLMGGGLTDLGDFKSAVNSVINALPVSSKVRAQLWAQNTPSLLYVFREGESQLCNN